MAEEGYEVIGPSGAPPPAAIPAFPVASSPGPPAPHNPPPPPPAVNVPPPAAAAPKEAKSSHSKASKVSKIEKKTKSTMSSRIEDPESVMEDPDGEHGINQRPNTCDVVQMAFTLFAIIFVVGASIPVLLASSGVSEIQWIRDSLIANNTAPK